MPRAFRITAPDGCPLGDADTLDEAIQLAKGAPPGRYRVHDFHLDPATGELRVWEWGASIKDAEGRITLDLPPRID